MYESEILDHLAAGAGGRVSPGSFWRVWAQAIAPLPYVLLGVGCGAFGWGAGELLRQWAVRADPGLEKQIRIEQTDERNQLVANKAKARAYDASVYIYSALMLCFALMQVRLSAVLLLVGGYLLTTGIYVYFQIHYNKEM